MKKITLFLLTICSILMFAQKDGTDNKMPTPMTFTKNIQKLPTKIFKTSKEYNDDFALLNNLDPRVYGQVPFINSIRSQKFDAANATYDCTAADDFTVPAGQIWEIKNIAADGYILSSKNPDSFNVTVYANSGANLPGTIIRQENIQPSAGTQSPNLSLGTSLLLNPGKYWISVQAVADLPGDWFWQTYADSSTLGSPFVWINPGNGFGTTCSANWGVGSVCSPGAAKDLSFTLNGNILSSCKTFTDKIISTDPTQSLRVTRDGNPSVCGTPKVYPGNIGAGNYHYKKYTIQNTSASAECVNIILTNPEANQMFAVAYSGSFNPANISQNYLADIGASPFSGSSSNMAFTMPASSTVVLVVSEVVVNTTFANNYTLNVIAGNCGSILKTGEVKDASVNIYPNPVRTLLYVNGMKMNEAKVYDASGKLIPVKSTENQINVERLTKGNYLLQMKDKSGNVHQDKFIKN